MIILCTKMHFTRDLVNIYVYKLVHRFLTYKQYFWQNFRQVRKGVSKTSKKFELCVQMRFKAIKSPTLRVIFLLEQVILGLFCGHETIDRNP